MSFELHSTMPCTPFITHINMGYTVTNRTPDCIAYINKLKNIGGSNSSGMLLLSASAGGLYGNTNYVIDDVRYDDPNQDYEHSAAVAAATNGLPAGSVYYLGEIESCTNVFLNTNGLLECTGYDPRPHIRSATNVAGYICWGSHSSLGGDYALYNQVVWLGDSRWYIIETMQSFSGLLCDGRGPFVRWFSEGAFGGLGYSNTPVGAVTTTDEPGLANVNDSSVYFRLWASGKHFGISAWSSRRTKRFQAVGDPFVRR